MRSMAMVGLIGLVGSALVGCGGTVSQQPGDVTFALTGVSSTVQPFDAQYQSFCHQNKDWTVVSAVVTVDEIDAKVNGQWVSIEKAPEQVDLLKLDNKTLNTLGVATIPTGKITGLRLILDPLGDYVVLKNGDKKPLTVPDSGIINITGKIDLDSCATGTLVLDFDPHIRTFSHPGLHDYILSGNANIKTTEVKNACGPATPPPDMADPCASVACIAGDVCQAGQCVPDPVCAARPAGSSCPSDQYCSAGTCVANPCAGFSGCDAAAGETCELLAGKPVCVK